jgi:hypothetical protein
MGKKKIDFWLEIANELKWDLNDTKKKNGESTRIL